MRRPASLRTLLDDYLRRLKPGASSGRRDYRLLAGPGAVMGVKSGQDAKKRPS